MISNQGLKLLKLATKNVIKHNYPFIEDTPMYPS
nr:MAG TPA: hypothetical protein [Caudoviricetes sp.]